MFEQVTRVYKVKETGAIKTQKFTLSDETVVSVRPSNRLGKDNHRATITTFSGATIEVVEKYSEVKGLVDNGIELKRVYKNKGTSEVKFQKYTLDLSAIESVRPSNRLGYPEHRATITLITGATVEVANTYEEVVAELD